MVITWTDLVKMLKGKGRVASIYYTAEKEVYTGPIQEIRFLRKGRQQHGAFVVKLKWSAKRPMNASTDSWIFAGHGGTYEFNCFKDRPHAVSGNGFMVPTRKGHMDIHGPGYVLETEKIQGFPRLEETPA